MRVRRRDRSTRARRHVRSLARTRWRGLQLSTAAGATVNVRVSPAYGSDPGLVQQWADFFASRPHGPELALLRACIAPLDEVEDICGDDALGCYWANISSSWLPAAASRR